MPKDKVGARQAIRDFYWSLLRVEQPKSVSLFLNADRKQWTALDHLALPGDQSSISGGVMSLEMVECLVLGLDGVGREFFFDPATGKLPSVVPDLEGSATVPVLLFDRDRGVYVRREPDGSVGDVGERLPWAGPQVVPAPEPVVEGRRRAVTRMLSLMEEFGSGSDEDVYWVTEFLRSRPETDRFDTWEFDFGCWVGELVRSRAGGGVWVETDDGWRVVDKGSSPGVVVAPFGEVRLLLETGEGALGSLKEYVADAVARLAPSELRRVTPGLWPHSRTRDRRDVPRRHGGDPYVVEGMSGAP